MENSPCSTSFSPQLFITVSPLINHVTNSAPKSPIAQYESFANSDLQKEGDSTSCCNYSVSAFDLDNFLEGQTPSLLSDFPLSFSLESEEKFPSNQKVLGILKKGSESNPSLNIEESLEGKLDHSTRVKLYMGARVSVDTRKANLVAFRAFVRSMLNQYLEESPEKFSEDLFLKCGS